MYPEGQYARILTEMKDMVRYHSYHMDEMLNMLPLEYQATRLMIAADIKQEMEENAKNK